MIPPRPRPRRSPRGVRRVTAAAIALACIAAPVAVVAAGCGDGDALVGGNCASGYTPCGTNCCPVAGDGAIDATADGSDGSRPYDGSGADRFGPGQDGASDGSLDTGPIEAGRGDSSPVDATSGDATEGDATSGDAAPGDAPPGDTSPVDDASDAEGDAAETGPACTPPLVDCGGTCVDTTNDPLNCGQCFFLCPSQICSMSKCVGSTAGGIVFIGHDYLTTPGGSAQARVLTNATFITQNNPLAVMSFEHYANATAVGRVKSILTTAATQVGLKIKITSTSVDGDIPSKLVFPNFQVLVVEDQSTAPAGALAPLGSSWASTLTTFTQAGGVVIVLDGGTGTIVPDGGGPGMGEMDAFTTATGLLSVSGQSNVTGTFLDDVAKGDVVGVNVVSPYSAGVNSVSVTTEPNGGSVTYVIDEQTDAGPGAPVVVHKVF